MRHSRPDCLSHDARRGGILFHTEADPELYRGNSFGDVAHRLLCEIAARVAGLAPGQASRVCDNLYPLRATEELVHRNAKILTLDVPQRDPAFSNSWQLQFWDVANINAGCLSLLKNVHGSPNMRIA